MNEKIVVLLTGATKTIGKKVLAQLALKEDLYEIRVFEKRSTQSVRLFSKYGDKIKVYYGDIANPGDTVEVSKRVNVVLHLESVTPPEAYKKPDLAESINVIGTQNLINNVSLYSPDAFFLYNSSVAVYGDRLKIPYIKVTDPLSPSMGDNYALTKIQAEKIVQESRLDWAIFRTSAIMEVGKKNLTRFLFRMPLETSLELISADDAARAFVNAYENKTHLWGRIFNLGGGKTCRTTCSEFLKANFALIGLGELDFPKHAFATRNYHCGFYADGDDLENIIHFRQDSYSDYLKLLEQSVSNASYWKTHLMKGLIKSNLLKRSEPYAAWKRKDKKRIKYFF